MADQLHCPMSYTVYKFQPETGTFSACCDAEPYEFNQDLFETLGDNYFTHHPKLIERKEALYNNIRHSDCAQCWTKEDQGLTSMRMNLGWHYPELLNNRNLSTHMSYPSRFELWMNSTCNLGCFMCQLGNSNTLRKIWYTDYNTDGHDGRGYESYLNGSSYYQGNYHSKYVDRMLTFINSHIGSNLGALCIAYLGGEPTLHSEMYEHADMFIDAGRKAILNGKELKIEITTNGTSKDKLNDRFYEMFEKYKSAGWKTRIMLSQDAANQYAQIRHGSNFQQIEKNFNNWIRPDSPVDELNSFSVISAINLPYIDELAMYIDNAIRNNYDDKKIMSVRFNTLIIPNWMNISNLPKKFADRPLKDAMDIFNKIDLDYKNIFYDNTTLASVETYLKESIQPEAVATFFNRLDYTNRIYQKSYPEWDFYNTFPFLSEYKQEYGIN